MTTMSFALADLLKTSKELDYTATAMLNRSRSVDAVLVRIGLESTTSIAASISEEGLFKWIGEKIEALGHKLWVVVNKAFAKLTGASEKTKELIERAKTDRKVKLPLSPAMVGHILGVGVMLTTALGLATAFKIGDGYKLDQTIAKCKDVLGRMKDTPETAGSRGSVARNIAKDENALNKNYLYRFAKSLYGIYKKMADTIKGFVRTIPGLKAKAGSPSEKDSRSIWKRVKDMASSVFKVFSVFREWFAKIPNMFKKTDPKLLAAPLKALPKPS